jgi:hypothetical protein
MAGCMRHLQVECRLPFIWWRCDDSAADMLFFPLCNIACSACLNEPRSVLHIEWFFSPYHGLGRGCNV